VKTERKAAVCKPRREATKETTSDFWPQDCGAAQTILVSREKRYLGQIFTVHHHVQVSFPCSLLLWLL
jgi:hypothetical protein